MRLSARDQIIIGVVVTVLVAIAVFFLFIMPMFGEISDLEAELQQIQTDTAEARTLLARRQDAKAQAAETQVRLLDIASRFPEAPELPALIIELQDVANRVEIDFIQMSPEEPVALEGNAGVSALGVSIQIQGDWRQYIDFLEELSDLRREVRITNWSISAVPPEDVAVTGATAEGEGTVAADDEEEELTEEDLMYTVAANVSLEAYMMEAELSSGGGDEQQAPAPPSE
jgi:Tfp pilus assembly protein PilO